MAKMRIVLREAIRRDEEGRRRADRRAKLAIPPRRMPIPYPLAGIAPSVEKGGLRKKYRRRSKGTAKARALR